MSDSIEFCPHSDKQEDLIFSDADITIGSTGTQWGKSQAGTLWMQRQMFSFTDPKDNFIVGAPTYKILNQSIIPYFIYHFKPFGKFNHSDAVFKLHEGGTCYFRTESDPDSIVGIPNVKAGWLDEAGKLRLYFWENYQARAAAKGAKTLLTSSPYALNWFWHKLVKPAYNGLRPDIKLVRAASWENPFHTLHDPAKRQAMRETMDPRRFDMIFGGEFGQMQGLVYDCWDDDQNYIAEFKLPEGTKYYGGIDWGFTEPFALKIRALLPNGDQIGVSEFYKSGQTISDIKEVCKKKMNIYGVAMFFCDPSQPGSILELNRAGIPAVAANNDVRPGIDAHYELIKTRKYKEFIGACPHTQDERETYHYPEPEDLKPDDNAKEKKPVQQNDHLCLAGNTLVETIHGPKRIDEIQLGEKVLTPLGYKEVTGAGMTGIEDTIVARFSDNSALEMTENHPVYIAFNGFQKLDCKHYGAIVHACKTRSDLTVKTTDGTVSIGRQSAGVQTVEKDCMLPFGKWLTAQCQRAITYITKITTDTITTYQTWNVCLSTNTGCTTPLIYQPNIGPSSLLIASESGHSQRPGTEAPKAGRGIQSTERKSLLIANQSRLFVNYVRKISSQLALTPSFARIIASRKTDADLVLTILRSAARSALNFLLKTNTQKNEPVRLSALSYSPTKQKVYNLTVKNAGCFYANGILVSNCDADRYLSISLSATGEKRKPIISEGKPKIHRDDMRAYFESLKKKRPGGRVINDL